MSRREGKSQKSRKREIMGGESCSWGERTCQDSLMNEGGETVLELKRWQRRKRYEKRAVVGKK